MESKYNWGNMGEIRSHNLRITVPDTWREEWFPGENDPWLAEYVDTIFRFNAHDFSDEKDMVDIKAANMFTGLVLVDSWRKHKNPRQEAQRLLAGGAVQFSGARELLGQLGPVVLDKVAEGLAFQIRSLVDIWDCMSVYCAEINAGQPKELEEYLNYLKEFVRIRAHVDAALRLFKDITGLTKQTLALLHSVATLDGESKELLARMPVFNPDSEVFTDREEISRIVHASLARYWGEIVQGQFTGVDYPWEDFCLQKN